MAYRPPPLIEGPDFMSQFMAGWGLAQNRKRMQMEQEAFRRDMERETFDRQQRQEALKLQKQEIDLRMKRARQEDAIRDFELRSKSQMPAGLPAPTAADVGIQQAVPDVGPPVEQINVPQPTQAIPAMEGPDIQAPILTGAQEAELGRRAQQQKLLDALMLKRADFEAAEPFKIAEDERRSKLQAQRDAAAASRAEAAGIRAEKRAAATAATAAGTAKSEGERTKVEVAQYALKQMPEWQSFFKKNKSQFGFYAGRATEARQSGALSPLGIKPDQKTATFTASLARMSNAMINALSGAAVSPAEYDRLKKEIPQITDPPEVIEGKMAVLDDFFKFRLQNFNAPYTGPGWQQNQQGTDMEPPDA